MKKLIYIFISIFFIVLCGELFSSPKTIIGQKDNMNIWQINHFFNTFSTQHLGLINDTSKVIILDKYKVNNTYMIKVTDGINATLLKSKNIYDFVNKEDTVNMITIYEPVNVNRYMIKHKILK